MECKWILSTTLTSIFILKRERALWPLFLQSLILKCYIHIHMYIYIFCFFQCLAYFQPLLLAPSSQLGHPPDGTQTLFAGPVREGAFGKQHILSCTNSHWVARVDEGSGCNHKDQHFWVWEHPRALNCKSFSWRSPQPFWDGTRLQTVLKKSF